MRRDRTRWTLLGSLLLPALLLGGCPGTAGVPGDGPPVREGALAWPDGTLGDGALGDGARREQGPPGDSRPDRARDRQAVPGFTYYQLNHLLGTGQSLSVGALGTPPLSVTQPFDNKMFAGGVIPGGTNLTALAPLVETQVETLSSGLANLVTHLARSAVFATLPMPQRSHELLVSAHGVGGQPYSALKKGTVPYANGLAQVKAGLALATAAKLSYVVRAVTNVHGESDHAKNNLGYAADLAAWQADYEADIKALTGQSEPVPMLHTQFSSWTKYNSVTSAVALLQLQASVAQPAKLVLVGPKYFLPYVADGVHLTNQGYRWMGEHYAKVYRRVVLERQAWEPLRPKSVTRVGQAVTVQFHVPVPPLVLDETLVTNPGHYGFEYRDASASPPTITAVALVGPDAVQLLLSKVPTGAQRTLGYANRGVLGAPAGPTTGPRGNLRDSDATPSLAGQPLHNWAVHFSEPVP